MGRGRALCSVNVRAIESPDRRKPAGVFHAPKILLARARRLVYWRHMTDSGLLLLALGFAICTYRQQKSKYTGEPNDHPGLLRSPPCFDADASPPHRSGVPSHGVTKQTRPVSCGEWPAFGLRQRPGTARAEAPVAPGFHHAGPSLGGRADAPTGRMPAPSTVTLPRQLLSGQSSSLILVLQQGAIIVGAREPIVRVEDICWATARRRLKQPRRCFPQGEALSAACTTGPFRRLLGS